MLLKYISHLITITIAKGWQCQAGRVRLIHPDGQRQPPKEKKREGKTVENKKGTGSLGQLKNTGTHHRIQGQQDRFTEILRGE